MPGVGAGVGAGVETGAGADGVVTGFDAVLLDAFTEWLSGVSVGSDDVCGSAFGCGYIGLGVALGIGVSMALAGIVACSVTGETDGDGIGVSTVGL